MLLTAAERERLKKMAYGHKTEYRLRVRAQVVPHAALGRSNGSSHRGKKAIDRLTKAFPNAVMVHTPVHASWTNQIEIFFSIVQRKVVQPNDFTDLTQVRNRLRSFEDHYNATAQPFQWKFTTSDLDDLLARLDRRPPPRPTRRILRRPGSLINPERLPELTT